jgi:hypothetical protein
MIKENEKYSAKCPCGFETKEILVEKQKQHDYVGVPVGCFTCQRVWVQDEKTGRKKCRKCKSPIYYLLEPETDPIAMYGLDGFKPNTCPKCREKKLTFVACGMWD